MKPQKFLLLLLALLTMSCSKEPAPVPEPEPPGNVAHDEMFLRDQSDDPHLMDIYLPETTAETPPQPILFFIHGGSWCTGSKEYLTQPQMKVLSRGKYAVVSTNYTLATYGTPNLLIPKVLSDLAVNIKWLQEHAHEYDMDGGRIIIMGHSSGAHMTALCGIDRSYFSAVDADFGAIKGAICLDGGPYLSDVGKLFLSEYQPWSGAIMIPWLSVAGSDPRVWPQYIPAGIIDPSVANPPFLLIHSSKYNYRYESNEAFEAALKGADIEVERHPLAWEHEDFLRNLGSGIAEYNSTLNSWLDIHF